MLSISFLKHSIVPKFHLSLVCNHRRFVYTSSSFQHALTVLRLKQKTEYTTSELRDAYFTAAKLCHPDSKPSMNKKGNNGDHVDDSSWDFLEVTKAYEFLQTRGGKGSNKEKYYDEKHIIHKTDEDNFRDACRDYLGVDAETVEESKRCPLFREWLKGKTDAAFHWNNFFMLNGGLAPMLNEKKVFRLSDGDGVGIGIGKRRRRKT
mmetsp:Transcript_3876/g.5074  ORF Transcript_3876/g.5074 Transcript_3876/m.5074 type:complete len:206 (-) Transcript_3876:70-687(-)